MNILKLIVNPTFEKTLFVILSLFGVDGSGELESTFRLSGLCGIEKH